jgi:uncharacterized membrane protein YgcG
MTSSQTTRPGWLTRLRRLALHRWHDDRLARTIPAGLSQRLAQQVTASEQRHSGQIRICIEGGLPGSYLWRGASARERAVTQFGKLRVWDTEHNNGVLIYLLLAEHAIEIVADRGLARRVEPALWQAMVVRMREAFMSESYEAGLQQAIEEVTALLVQHFPHAPNDDGNELPDPPVIGRHR